MRQLPLGVRIADRAVFATFLPARNREAVEHLEHISNGTRGGTTWICGGPGVGKTHLLQAVCVAASEGTRTAYFPMEEIEPLGVEALEGWPQFDILCCDDVDQVIGRMDWEHALFALLREMEERGARLVVSSSQPPALHAWALPDLGSRFGASSIFQLRALDDAEQQAGLQLHARARGFELPDDAAKWLQKRFPRDMRSLHSLLDALDEAALVAQRKLTIPFIRDALRQSSLESHG